MRNTFSTLATMQHLERLLECNGFGSGDSDGVLRTYVFATYAPVVRFLDFPRSDFEIGISPNDAKLIAKLAKCWER